MHAAGAHRLFGTAPLFLEQQESLVTDWCARRCAFSWSKAVPATRRLRRRKGVERRRSGCKRTRKQESKKSQRARRAGRFSNLFDDEVQAGIHASEGHEMVVGEAQAKVKVCAIPAACTATAIARTYARTRHDTAWYATYAHRAAPRCVASRHAKVFMELKGSDGAFVLKGDRCCRWPFPA